MTEYEYESLSGENEQIREAHITDLLFKLGSQDLYAQILRLAALIMRDWQTESSAVKKVLIACASELSDKATLYALLLAVISGQNETVGAELIAAVNQAMQDFLNAGKWRQVKVLLRFIGELTVLRLISDADYLSLVNLFVSVIDDVNSREERKDVFIASVISCLPWFGIHLKKTFPKELAALIQKIDDYIQDGRPSRLEASSINRVFGESCPYKQLDALALSWIQVRNCEENGWDCMMVNRPAIETFTDTLQKIKTVAFPAVSLPAESPILVYPPPYTHFEVFHPSCVTSKGKTVINLPPTESVDRMIMYDILEDLIFFFGHNHTQLVKYLFQGLYVSEEVLNQYSFHQALIEIVTRKILCLPQPEFKIIYYIRLSMELCAQSSKIVPGIFAKAINTLYEHIEIMDVECQNRLSTWFSIHLSNFAFKWNWADWKEDFEADGKNAKSLFVKETLDKLLKLSYYDRLTEVFSENLKPLQETSIFPQAPEFYYAYAEGTQAKAEHVKFAADVVEKMRLKTPFEDMLPLVVQIKKEGSDALVRDIVLQSVLFLGSKSFSFVLNLLERNFKLLQHVAQNSTEEKIHLIKIASSFWVTNKLMFTITLDKMINYKIIDYNAVIQWIFTEAKQDFTRVYIWEILKSNVYKLNNRIKLWNERLEDKMDTDISDQNPVASQAQDNLNGLQRDMKQLFLSVFENFMRVYKGNQNESELWRTWCWGMMVEFAREFHGEIKTFANTLEMVVFSQADQQFKEMFHKIQAMHK